MSLEIVDINDLKRRVRKLKHFENVIRFSGEERPVSQLVWDRYFDLRASPTSKAKYTLNMLAAMSREEYRSVVDEFFAMVYYELYSENGISVSVTHDPSLLSQLNLPFNADEIDIKRRFRELAKEHHPDTGGMAEKFIELMKTYEGLLGR